MWSPDSYRETSSELNSSSSSDLCQNIGAKKRKSFSPRKSSLLNDPDFRGVTIWYEDQYIDKKLKLYIRSEFCLSPKKRKTKFYVESSDEDESPSPGSYSYNNEAEKHCASCSAVKTPLWRDAEDGTPLCNACGIRYKKYKLRCGMCWHIPKKDEFSPRCISCGSLYQYVSPRR